VPIPPAVRAEAEACYLRAIEVARARQARLWELRATMSLCCLWRAEGTQDRIESARQALSEIYGWFSEGFDTPDLQDAKRLLEDLSVAHDAHVPCVQSGGAL
jgi:predicted ATPase